jgi:hypothetical protein
MGLLDWWATNSIQLKQILISFIAAVGPAIFEVDRFTISQQILISGNISISGIDT